jgi:small GTP-binding protein
MTGENPDFEYQYLAKCVLLGNCAVGKSCLLHRQTHDAHHASLQTTIGVDYGVTIVPTNTWRWRLDVYDTAGHPNFLSIIKSYLRDQAVYLVVYDVTDRASFLDVRRRWVPLLRQAWAAEGDTTHRPHPPLVALVGNKVDCLGARTVTWVEGQALARELGWQIFVEVSARTGVRVATLFQRVADALSSRVTGEEEDDADLGAGIKAQSMFEVPLLDVPCTLQEWEESLTRCGKCVIL